MELRSNQIEPVRIGIEFFKQEKCVPSIIVAPTAFGKSILIAKIAESVTDNLLILQPSKELLEQNLGKYVALGGKASIYSASFGSKRITRVTYATVGSIKSLGKRFKEMGFTKMIIDEADQYPRSHGMLGGFLKDSGIIKVLGLTATPLKLQNNMDMYGNPYSKLMMLTSRSKKGKFYKEIISVSQIQDIVKLGYWSKLVYEVEETSQTSLKYNSTKAEFTDVSVKINYEENNTHSKIVRKVMELPDRKSILVFAPSIEAAKALAAQIPGSAVVYSGMPPKERTRITAAFKALKIRVVINCNIFSIGFDHPQLDCIIDGYATGSITRYYQKLGRGTRIFEGKIDCLIVDFSGNVKRFGKIEHLYYEKDGDIWKMYGENDMLLSGIPMHEIGKHFKNKKIVAAPVVDVSVEAAAQETINFGTHVGLPLSKVPISYLRWMLSGKFQWRETNIHLKEPIQKYYSSLAIQT